jgi:Tfp pilus assembly protein PilX
MSKKKVMRFKRRGAVLVLVTIAAVLLTLVGVGLLQVGLSNRLFAIASVHKIKACSAADAGLMIALSEMNEMLLTQSFSDSTLPEATDFSLPYCDGVCSYAVTGNLAGGYTITSIGETSRAQKSVSTTVQLKGLFDNAILTKAGLILKSGTLIDGYNSQNPLDTSTDADIATQSTADSSIVLNSGVELNGDVRVGLGGNPDAAIKDLGATVEGSKYGATTKYPLDRITAPDDLFDMGSSIDAKGSTVTIGPADSGSYTAITLKSTGIPGVIEIDGGDVELHITGDIEVGQGCEIVVKDGSSLVLYADSDIHCREGSGITVESPTKESETLKLYATSEDTQYFDIKAKSEWVGVVYAPNADVDLYAGGDVYGAVVADNFDFKAGGNYHYDRALKEVSIEDEGVRFVIKRWDED